MVNVIETCSQVNQINSTHSDSFRRLKLLVSTFETNGFKA